MSGPCADPAAPPRVLLWVTTQRDASITQRLFRSAGMEGCAVRSLHDLAGELRRGADALLATEEVVKVEGIEPLVRLLHPDEASADLPTVLLTKGGSGSILASGLLARLQNLTILERPAPISSIISAVQSAIRATKRQRDLVEQMKRIRELQEQFTLALRGSELGTFRYPLPHGPIHWDAQCRAHFFVANAETMEVEPFFQLLHPEDRERTRQALTRSVAQGEKYDVEYRVIAPSGAVRWIRATGQTLHDEHGAPKDFSGTTQDVTARKRLEEERNRLLESERAARVAGDRANRLKDEFLATLGHELRTPLNAITGWVEVLRMDAGDPEAFDEGLKVIERNVRAQAQLIDDLLDVSRIASGKVRLNLKAIPLAPVLAAALETVRPSAQAKGVRLAISCPADAPPVLVDSARLQQVVWNLLTNAIKFTPRGGEVAIRVTRLPGALEIAVADTGEGIPPDFLPYVFERFRQADGSESRPHGGLGLGLSIVKNLVEMHGGTVRAESPGPGRGATFSFRIPLRKGPPALEGTAMEAHRPLNLSTTVRPDLSGLRILVIDDEADSRGMMRRLLESCGAESCEAAQAPEGLRLALELPPDLILSDIGMPDVDGYQFIRQARLQGITAPAVAVTAFARSDDRMRALQAGFQAHLAKPIEPAGLFALVAGLTGRLPRAA